MLCSAAARGFPIIYVSPSFERLTGYRQGEVLGRSPGMLQGPETSPASVAVMRRALRTGQECHIVLLNYRRDGTAFWNEVFLSPIRDPAGTIVSYVGVLHDVSDRAEHEAKLTRLALHDALTGLPNRRLLEDRARVAVARASREGGAVALLLLDLDQFKRINDTLGHGAGDSLLCQVARRLQGVLRGSDTVARLGGDEFAILCEPGEWSESVHAVAARVLSVFEPPFEIGERRLPVTPSIGIAVSEDRHTSVESLLSEADMAMYRAKQHGHGCVEVFDRSAQDPAVGRLEVEGDLQQALEQRRLHVEYQPKVDLRSGDVRHVEAFVRWEHPNRGSIAPAAFIGLAEATGLVKRIGAYVLSVACRDAAAWERRLGEPLGFCVNLSASELVADDLLEVVQRALRAEGLSAGQIGFEWSESAVLSDRGRASANARALKRLGCYLTVEDFGAGSASLSHLVDFPASELKLDRALVATAADPDDVRGRALRTAIVHAARALDVISTAEGIEQAAQLEALRELGCDQGQGFVLGAPARFEALPELIAHGKRVARSLS